MKLYGTEPTDDDKQEAFRNGEVPVAVYGLGKMGLPLAAVYAEVTGNVEGVDIDPEVVESVSSGKSYIDGEPRLDELVADCVEKGSLTATTEAEEAAYNASVHVVIVPTLVTETNEPDLSTVISVIESIAAGIEKGDIVIVESTVPPRTSADLVEPSIAADNESDLEIGDFGVAFCPERTSSGRAIRDIRGAYPKIVGGTDDESTDAAEIIYGEISENDVIPVSDATTAEAVKVFEGVYRDVNIALANELARFTDDMGIDVMEAIEVANTLPYCDIHTPGAGVGGHCIPYYPYFLIEGFDVPSDLMQTAREINDSMPAFAVDKLLEGLNEQGKSVSEATVVVLGMTYRPGVEETRHSPAIQVVERLTGQGADVYVVDPVLDDFSEFEGAASVGMDEIYAVDPDGVVLLTAHEEFEGIDWSKFGNELAVVDGRQSIIDPDPRHWVYTIGRGGG